jgi:hypothetical protein
MDGLLTPEEWKRVVKLGIAGCKQVYEVQKKALKGKYELGDLEVGKKSSEPKAEKKEVKTEKAKKVKK